MTVDSSGNVCNRFLNPKDKEMLEWGWEFHTNISKSGISEFLPKYRGGDYKIIDETFNLNGRYYDEGVAVYRKIKPDPVKPEVSRRTIKKEE